jgi:hypothetical protein
LRSTGWAGPQFSLSQAVRDYVGRYLVPGLFLEPELKQDVLR